MSNDFEEQLIINSDPDVTLIVDKAKIKVHKNFLSSKSATFAEMLNTKKINGCIEVKNIAPTTMLHLIKYLYTGKIELEVDTIEMLKAAHQVCHYTVSIALYSNILAHSKSLTCLV